MSNLGHQNRFTLEGSELTFSVRPAESAKQSIVPDEVIVNIESVGGGVRRGISMLLQDLMGQDLVFKRVSELHSEIDRYDYATKDGLTLSLQNSVWAIYLSVKYDLGNHTADFRVPDSFESLLQDA